jgi:hypothetical protein
MLRPSTLRYKKPMYAILITKQKLRHYFDSHPMTKITLFPLDEVIYLEPRSHRENHEVGPRADGTWCHICPLNSN